MYKNLKKISTKNMSREEWLEHRRHSIGGSDAASIVGMNQYSSPYAVWADKMGKLPPKEDNEAMRLGRDLEEYVGKRFCEETGKKLRRENNIIVNPDFPFAHANVDRMVIGEDAGFEAKTTTVLNLKKFKNGEYPANYYCQCMHYMAITGCQRWYLGVLILGVEFKWFVIERDEDEIAALMRSEAEFWRFVESGNPPMADGSKATTEAIKTIYAESDDTCVNLFGYEADLKSYANLVSLKKEVEGQMDEIANRIKVFMGESERGDAGGFRVSWASQARSTFDHKRFASEHPSIDLSGYYKKTVTRAFKVTETEI